MVTFQIPVQDKRGSGDEVFSFSAARCSVLPAGSRYAEVPQATCLKLIQGLHQHGFGFFVGCAPGVDRCFREVLWWYR